MMEFQIALSQVTCALWLAVPVLLSEEKSGNVLPGSTVERLLCLKANRNVTIRDQLGLGANEHPGHPLIRDYFRDLQNANWKI